MAKIVPRWEWRWFGRSFGPAEARLAELTPGAVQESDEIYLLSGAGENVKVRDALMDIKVLRETSADGLEQWTPVMKAGFPLPAAQVRTVLEALRLEPSAPRRAHYALEEFLDEFAGPGGRIRAVPVHKRRVRHTIAGCPGELSEVIADGRPTRTLAVESEDAEAVLGAVRSLGLAGYVNTSYPRGLAALIDGAPRRYAVIDVGTNSIKFQLGESSPDGAWRVLTDRAEVTRLGEGMSAERRIGEAALERAVAAIAGMAAEAREQGALAIVAVGTAGLRAAANGAEVIEAIRARTGVLVEVISGTEEGRLAYVATAAALPQMRGALVVVDTGGGSTQFTFGRGREVEERFSVEVGAVRYTERFGLDRVVSDETLRDVFAALAADLSRLDGRPSPDALVAMGGAATNITAVRHGLSRYDPERVQGTVLGRAEIDRQIELYRSRDAAARRSIVGLQPNRAEVILAGACVLRTVMDKLGKQDMTVSDRGLRHGVLAERFGV